MEETDNNLLENLQVQLDELETLQAMFYNPGEVKIEDISAFLDIKDFVAGKTTVVPPCLDLSVNLVIDSVKFELCVGLSHEYPFTTPEIFVRNNKITRKQHVQLNKDMGEFILELPKGEACIFSAISWLQDNALNYIDLEKPEINTQPIQEDEELVRYWIYSHHIYSKTKRKALIDLAQQLNVMGFIMPGKPGIICVEGNSSDVSEWWQTVKSMNWKKIFCKVTESNKEDQNSANFIKHKTFVELVFENNSLKYNHMDMGEFYRYLEEHELGYIFKDIFGVDAKSG